MNVDSLWVGGYGPVTSAHSRGLDAFRRVVESETNGGVEVEVTWNIMDDGRPATDLFELVECGDMFLCYFSSSYLAARGRDVNVLETPFLFTSVDDAHRALDGALGDELSRAIRAQTGFEVLGYWDNGMRHLTNRVRPVRTPGDCAGLTVRIQPNAIHEELVRAWGATPVPAELSEGIRLISSQAVDAQENPLANTAAYGVDRVHSHITMTGHLYGARGLFAHRTTVESLPDDLLAIVRRAVATAIEVQRAGAASDEASLRTEMEQAGIDFVDLTEQERSVFMDASRPAIELARRGISERLLAMVAS